MGCMCERTRIKHKPRKKLNKTDQTYRDCNKAQPYENFTYGKGHVTINYNVNEETTSNVPSDYLDEVGNFIASKLVKLNNSISSKSNLITSSHYLVRHSLSLYAASSVIIALCYLTTSTTALDTSNPIFAEGKSDKEILDHLLKNSRYDKRLLPPVDGTLTVNVNVLLLSLASPDESSLKYEVEFLLNQQWYDPRLRYANHSQYEYLNAIHHHDDIWLPDTYFIMHGDFKHPLVPMHFALRIFRNGTITYSMRRHLILSCQGSLNIFPFDDPLCSFALESISYELSAITYVWKNDEDTLRKSPSLTTLNAYLIKNSTIPCPVKNSWRGNYSCLQVDLTFTRDRAFYFTTVFIPGIILVTSSFITFWLEWNAVPARVMIGVTTMLNFFTTSNSFRGTLPVVSNLTAMNVWDGVCMCFIYASLLEFVCVNYVGRKRPLHNVVYRPGENPVTQRLPAVLSRIGIILASPLEIIEQEFLAAVSSEKSDQQPHHTGGTLRPNLRRRTTVQSGDSSRARGDTDESFHLRVLRTSENIAKGDTNVNDGRALISSSSTSPSSASPPTSPLSNVSYTSSIMSPPPIIITTASETELSDGVSDDVERGEERCPIRPPRRKMSRSHTIDVDITPACENMNATTATTPQTATSSTTPTTAILESPSEKLELETFKDLFPGFAQGEKKRDTGGPNEIVACTNCGGGTSPCTHSANNGCATETCFVQVRKKEPPHPIRVAKTIDVIARITFPTAYAIFLIFFFVHYKGST